MKARTCPNCQHTHSVRAYWKLAFQAKSGDFDCENCGQRLTFKLRTRAFIALIAALPILAGRHVATYLGELLGTSHWVGFAIFALFLIAWMGFVYSFERFKLSE